jgi:hypothetical protein
VKRTRTRTPTRTEAELPDVRDGLTRTERIVLTTLNELQRERGDRHVPVIELWGRLVEQVDLSQDELQKILSRLSGRSSG